MAYSFAAHLDRYGPHRKRLLPMTVDFARRYCERLARSHYENFTVASALLPRRLLKHYYPIYAYCRWADDLADETAGGGRALGLLRWWREELLRCYQGRATHPVMIALRPTVEQFRIPAQPFLNLLFAFEQDQLVKRYQTYEELLGYCRHSANPVGRLVLYLFGCFDERRAELSDRICTGLQLANFWQDVARDLNIGRVYIPEEDRRRFGYPDADLYARRCTPAFRELMRFEVERARDLFYRGMPLVEEVPAEARVEVDLFIRGGLAILRAIERQGYDVFRRRPEVGKWRKAALFAGALARSCAPAARGAAAPVPEAPPAAPASVSGSVAYCERLARRAGSNFVYAFSLLPPPQRRAMNVLYAFLRCTDDLVDGPEPAEVKRERLRWWRDALGEALAGRYRTRLHPALHAVVRRYRIPPEYLYAAIDGAETDLEPVRFATFGELYAYCYRAASVVGLACIHIWGYDREEAKRYAEAAGVAFQLTNILRDLAEDLRRGRVYLPAEDLERFRCPAPEWERGGPAFAEMMRFQVERARRYFERSRALEDHLSPTGRAVFRLMSATYRGLLGAIEARGYDVFGRRVRLSRWRKLGLFLRALPVRWGW